MEDPAGDEYVRFRYSLGAEDERRSDTVRLSSTPTTFTEGDRYRQLAHELHASWQQPGTVTAIRCSWVEPRRANRLPSRRRLLALGARARRHRRRDQDLHGQSSGVVLMVRGGER